MVELFKLQLTWFIYFIFPTGCTGEQGGPVKARVYSQQVANVREAWA